MSTRLTQTEPPPEQTLKREVGWYGSFAMGYADVGADIFVALGLVTLYAAGASPIAFLIASITYLATGLAYAELASTYPYAGGAQIYAMKALNDPAGFVAGWAVMLDYTVNIGLFSLASAGYLSFFFPHLKTAVLPIPVMGTIINVHYLGLVAFAMVAGLIFINLVGIRGSSLLNEILVGWGILAQALILVTGALLAFSLVMFWDQLHIVGSATRFLTVQYVFSSIDVSTQNFMYGVTIAMTSFIGIESIAQAAEETRRPYKWIPRANKLSILSVMVFTIGFSTLSLGIMPWGDIATSATDPIAVLASRIPTIGTLLGPFVALTGLVICYVSTNTGVIGVSRIAYSMGRFKLLPSWFYKVHPKFRTPTRAIVVFGLLGAAMALIGDLPLVADLYAFGALLSYLLVNLCLIILRNKEPEAYRPWKIPGNVTFRVRGRSLIIPVLSVIGVISCLVIWSLILGFHERGRVLGIAWVLIGVVGFLVYRRIEGIPIVDSRLAEQIVPGGYTMNAVVLVRTPESEEIVRESIEHALDNRFRLTLLSIIDPHELGLATDDVKGYMQLKQEEARAAIELERISKRLREDGYQSRVRVEVGNLTKVVELEAQSDQNDVLVLIKRRTLKGHFEKEREDSILAAVSKYPGKVMVVRRMS